VEHSDTTLLLFYQYVEPAWDESTYKMVLQKMEHMGKNLGGRMRVAREGLNCTLTGTHKAISTFCQTLRKFHKGEFEPTEFKLTRDLSTNQHFSGLKVMPVQELVNYGLEGGKAPPIGYTGVHLDPKDYHQKLAESDTVVIDVRNHYEAAIGHFDAPGAKMLDPKMRKSTEFPIWLDKPETKEKLRGKQVLMYCTGGVRCERASALLKYKMDKDPEIKDLGIQGVFQLQGGIDKYFKEFPQGGFWSGKNYTFDKRFAHAPPKIDGEMTSADKEANEEMKGSCEACGIAWDKYRGKRRCPTCGVPSLICKDCFLKDKSGQQKLDRSVRCVLCVEENIRSKAQLREREEKDMQEYESNLKRKGLLSIDELDHKSSEPKVAPNPDGVTRLFLKNMCRKSMNEDVLIQTLPGVTHIVWRTDRKTESFSGQGWIEMATAEDAAVAMGMNGSMVLGRPLYMSYQPADGKDMWPPRNSAV
jgi:predicted sulfurtransferase